MCGQEVLRCAILQSVRHDPLDNARSHVLPNSSTFWSFLPLCPLCTFCCTTRVHVQPCCCVRLHRLVVQVPVATVLSLPLRPVPPPVRLPRARPPARLPRARPPARQPRARPPALPRARRRAKLRLQKTPIIPTVPLVPLSMKEPLILQKNQLITGTKLPKVPGQPKPRVVTRIRVNP